MKQTINKYEFERAFKDAGRGDQFSYKGLNLLFDLFEQLDENCGTETELDVIAMCCEWSEETTEEIADNYSIPAGEVEQYLNENTLVAGQSEEGIYVYASF